jgi:hypothetical protein
MKNKLSPMMWKVLIDIREGRGTHHDCHGMSAHGGRSSVIMALCKRGLIAPDVDKEYVLTELGTAAAKEVRCPGQLRPKALPTRR